jgi:hypothetical protein
MPRRSLFCGPETIGQSAVAALDSSGVVEGSGMEIQGAGALDANMIIWRKNAYQGALPLPDESSRSGQVAATMSRARAMPERQG